MSKTLNLRLCSFCKTDEIKNEIHFLFFCRLYDSLRVKFFNIITEKYTHFKELDTQSKILFLFNSIDPTSLRSKRFRGVLRFQKYENRLFSAENSTETH